MASFSAVLTMGREAVARYQLFGTGAVELAQWIADDESLKGVLGY